MAFVTSQAKVTLPNTACTGPLPRRVQSEALLDSRAVKYAGTSEGQAATGGYSDEEEDQVIERLKDLAYIS